MQSEFDRLLCQVHHSQRHAFSQGTNSNLRSQFRNYLSFCTYFECIPLPANLSTLCAYIQFLSRSVAPPTIRNYLSGVKLLHILLGFEYAFSGNLCLRLVLRGITRLHPHVPCRAPPITPQNLLAVSQVLDHSNSLHCTVFACGLFLFFLLARLGSVLPVSARTASRLYLGRHCVSVSSFGLLVTFRHTKTIQFGRRLLHIPLVRVPGSPLCPVQAYERVLQFHQGHEFTAAFGFMLKGRIRVLTRSTFITTFRALLSRAGVPDSSSFRGHSFRRGGASWAFRSGVPGELIQVCGDWTSDAYKLYLEFSMYSKVLFASQVTSCLPAISY